MIRLEVQVSGSKAYRFRFWGLGSTGSMEWYSRLHRSCIGSQQGIAIYPERELHLQHGASGARLRPHVPPLELSCVFRKEAWV